MENNPDMSLHGMSASIKVFYNTFISADWSCQHDTGCRRVQGNINVDVVTDALRDVIITNNALIHEGMETGACHPRTTLP